MDAGPDYTIIGFVTPGLGAYVEGVVRVELAVRGPAPDRIQLFIDRIAGAIASLTEPYTYDLDTSRDPEGPLVLLAQAIRAGEVVAEARRTLTVDRTSPTVVTWPSEGNVFDGMRVVFSEAMASSTLNASTVELLVDGSPHPIDVSPSDTFVDLLPTADIEVLPTTATIQLSDAVTDLAGHSLGLQSSDIDFPRWVSISDLTFAAGGTILDIVEGSGGRLLVLYEVSDATYVARWSGRTWAARVAGPIGYTAGTIQGRVRELPSGEFVVALRDSSNVDVYRILGFPASRMGSFTSYGSIDLEVDGTDVYLARNTGVAVFVDRYRGGTFGMVDTIRPAGSVSSFDLVASSGRAFVLYRDSDGVCGQARVDFTPTLGPPLATGCTLLAATVGGDANIYAATTIGSTSTIHRIAGGDFLEAATDSFDPPIAVLRPATTGWIAKSGGTLPGVYRGDSTLLYEGPSMSGRFLTPGDTPHLLSGDVLYRINAL